MNPNDVTNGNINSLKNNYPDYDAKFSNNFQSPNSFGQTDKLNPHAISDGPNFIPSYDANPYNGPPTNPVLDGTSNNLTNTDSHQKDNFDPYNPANNQFNPANAKNMYPDYHQNMGDPNKFPQYTQNDVPPNMDYGNPYGKNNTFNPMYGDISPPIYVKESNIPKNHMSDETPTFSPDMKTYDSLESWKKETTPAGLDGSGNTEVTHVRGKRHKRRKRKMLDDLFADDGSQQGKPKSDQVAPKTSFEDPFKNSDHDFHTTIDSKSKEVKSGSQFENLSKDQLIKDKDKIDAILKDKKFLDSSSNEMTTASKPGGLWNKIANGGSWLYNVVTGVPKLKDVFVKDFKYYITDLDS
ncbi:uncharacterized protein LOC103520553 [Diaphorina citri]|uniref:Uncharacterized protein LOC103505497 isoform X1 n=1 Tax=Diaphorina citri TaxID=121845 RepID=A0A3Q0IK31_DIACI|nr:uncharacterized protein LOC103505497 isoform X1 [Diaphorina citri]XP_026676632.1 uncharacterized protein LOC103505497 isoform X1 [Diaphorina citri]XP_026676633.1 uncharacterized protein LOC103505497 isoform X2 [Diaphorina citri]XP_026687425.1 uncharacterized protein LOC103520553 [Diaphorina citri]